MAQKRSQQSRKAIRRSVRFEVFKRDSFRCQYCGASAPDVLLQIDHIKPVAGGGTDDVTNLITACAACNSGKCDKPLDDSSAVRKRKAQLDQLQERREQLEMMMRWMEELQDLKSQAIGKLADCWSGLAPGFSPNDRGRQKLRKWLTRYPVDEIMRAMEIAASQYLEFQEDDNVTRESWERAFNKIPGILNVERESKDNPDLKELFYIRGIVRNKCPHYFDPGQALQYLKKARKYGVPLAEIKEIALQTRNWSHFAHVIEEAIDTAAEMDAGSGQ